MGRSPGSRFNGSSRLPTLRQSTKQQWHIGTSLTGYSCGYSAGFAPVFPLAPDLRRDP